MRDSFAIEWNINVGADLTTYSEVTWVYFHLDQMTMPGNSLIVERMGDKLLHCTPPQFTAIGHARIRSHC